MAPSHRVRFGAFAVAVGVALLSAGATVQAAGDAPALQAARLANSVAPASLLAQGRPTSGRRTAFAWDLTYLYFTAGVSDESLEVQDDRTRDFVGSDRLVLLVSTNPGSSGERLAEQDFAFVFTPDSLYHKPLKTIYGFGGADHPDLDLRTVTVAAAPTTTPPGYLISGRLPWAALGLEPQAGLTLAVAVISVDVRPGAATVATSLAGQPLGAGIGRHLLQPLILGSQ